jgi:hypothetical protein
MKKSKCWEYDPGFIDYRYSFYNGCPSRSNLYILLFFYLKEIDQIVKQSDS